MTSLGVVFYQFIEIYQFIVLYEFMINLFCFCAFIFGVFV